MHPTVEVILNERAGAGCDRSLRDKIEALFRANGCEAHITSAPESRLTELAAEQARGPATVIVAGGGDGTISSIATALVGTDKILGVLPLGTLNHFSKDLGIAQEVESAVHTIVSGQIKRIDVGEVNGRIFLNNSSLGVYPIAVRDRESQQKHLGRGKRWAYVVAAFHLLRRYPKLTLLLTVDGQPLRRRSPFLFVGNNEYELTGFSLGERRVLDGGRLGLYVTPRTGRFDLYWLLLRAFFGRLERRRDFEFFRATEATVEMSGPDVLVATDGEVARMKAPLHFRTRPRALQVMVPRDDERK